ncbi:IS630 family transposase [Actinomycetes bacterium KLBMP 9797]
MEIAVRVGVSKPTVLAWRREFTERGMARFGQLAAGRGRKASIPQATIDRIVELTLHSRPEGATHWSCRSMAAVVGVSSATVQRVWDARGLKPHPERDVQAVHRSAVRAEAGRRGGPVSEPARPGDRVVHGREIPNPGLDRTQPSLPLKKGRAGTMRHDYKRHGTTTLFAALDVLTGKVIGKCFARHRHEEFLRFLRIIDTNVPRKLRVHMIVDNYGTRTHTDVQAWLAKHPRFHLHLTPTSSSWLNLVERWFADLTGKMIRRGVFGSVDDLIDAITEYLKVHNDDPKPFVWTATAQSILEKVRRGRVTLQQVSTQN